MATTDHLRLLGEAFAIGCKKVQFIGGEPTLDDDLPKLIIFARAIGYEFIEVFTNATLIRPDLMDVFVENGVEIATSFYSDDPTVHDSITGRRGSHNATVNNIKELIRRGIPVRVGIIAMEDNKGTENATMEFLHSLGVKSIHIDPVRSFGRGENMLASDGKNHDLCGNCWNGSLAITPQGDAIPCIMARGRVAGSVIGNTLQSILEATSIHDIRERLFLQSPHADVSTASCAPYCSPHCQPTCSPHCGPTCDPIRCAPRSCWPAMCIPGS